MATQAELDAISRQIASIQQNLNTFSQAKDAGLTLTSNTSIDQAKQYLNRPQTTEQQSAYQSPNINTGSYLSPILSGQINPNTASDYITSQVRQAYVNSTPGDVAGLNAFSVSGQQQINQILSQLQGQNVNYGGQSYQFGTGGQAVRTSTPINQSVTSAAGTTSTTGALNNYQYVDKQGNLQTVQAKNPEEAIRNAPNIASNSGVRILNATLPQSKAPSSAAEINNFPSVDLPSTSPSSGDISSASAFSSGYSEMLNLLQQQQKDYQTQLQQQQSQQNEVRSGLMDLIKRQPSRDELKQNAQNQTGIEPTNYFASQRAGLAEIQSLTEQYNAIKASKDQQIARSSGAYASQSFINNQIAQIERNAAPQLNQLSANINSKAANLQAQQGLFAEAQSYVNQAVQDSVADYQFRLQNLTLLYEMNQDSINRLDTKYQNAFNTALTLAQSEYENQLSMKTNVGKLMLEYPSAGITTTDSLDMAYSKASQVPATADAGDTQVVNAGGRQLLINSTTGSVIRDLGSSTSSTSADADEDEGQNLAEAGRLIESGQISIEEAKRRFLEFHPTGATRFDTYMENVTIPKSNEPGLFSKFWAWLSPKI